MFLNSFMFRSNILTLNGHLLLPHSGILLIPLAAIGHIKEAIILRTRSIPLTHWINRFQLLLMILLWWWIKILSACRECGSYVFFVRATVIPARIRWRCEVLVVVILLISWAHEAQLARRNVERESMVSSIDVCRLDGWIIVFLHLCSH